MHRPVIAAVNPLRDDIATAALALMLARLSRTQLLLASAYHADVHVDTIYPELSRSVRADAERTVRRIAALVRHAPGLRVPLGTTVTASAGLPARALHDLAEREDASVLVVGSSRRARAGRVLPGLVTDRVLDGAPCPVAIAPSGFSLDNAENGPRLIGVAFRDTPDGHAALARGCILAARARGRVRVLTVAEPPGALLSGPPEDDRAALEAAATALRRGLDEVAPGRSAGGEVLTGTPADALAAASRDVDLLVCGSRGYGPVLLGETSQALVRKAACPVLVVPALRLMAEGAGTRAA
jgi:nucleotide-binding universal stress UspA family protein